MYILGISAFYHDSAACLIKDGEILSAVQEERFTRIKHDAAFPINAINFCLKRENISIKDINYIAYYEKPFLKFERILESYLACVPFGVFSFLKSIPVWLKQKIWIKDIIKKELNYKGKIIFTEHHESHAASAFFTSSYEDAAFLTIDGTGEWCTTTYGKGENNKIKIMADIKFPHSLGLLYSAFTYYLGFKVNSDEYKVMGLAPYGEPVYKKTIYNNLIDLEEDGSFKLNLKYFNYVSGLTMTNKKFSKLFNLKPRKYNSVISQEHMNMASSIQQVTEEIIIKLAKHVKKITKKNNLCMAGGVALNCVANGRLLREKIFDKIYIQPSAGDAGGAIGAALITWYHYLNNNRIIESKKDFMKGALLGPDYSNEEIEKYLIKNKILYKKLNNTILLKETAKLINENKIIGWFQGRMEFGPRALGARSILANAKNENMREILNKKIKFRESFRPFASAVLEEDVSKYFDLQTKSSYMLLAMPVKESRLKKLSAKEQKLKGFDKLNIVRSNIPSVTHVDNSSRIQTVNKEDNPLFYKLLLQLKKDFKYSVIINTSFNRKDEPIVCTPEDAYKCFIKTEIDYLIMGNFLIKKSK
ncbi:MAG: carbamoyltransferase [Spirochaetia bacterium]|nr:carbamoyltransferase [Spirochaetia bacterium]